MQATKEQMDQLIELISHLGFNSRGQQNVPGTTEAIAIALRGIESNSMNISNALNDLDVTLTRMMQSLETIQHNQSNK
jgi:hypothetical protein